MGAKYQLVELSNTSPSLTIAPNRSIRVRACLTRLASHPSSSATSSVIEGPRRPMWSSSTASSPSAASMVCLTSGSTARAVAIDRYNDLPRCSLVSRASGPRVSWNDQIHFVFGHRSKPRPAGLAGASWHAANRLGSAQSGIRVSMPRSARNPTASSSVVRARSGVSRQRRDLSDSTSWAKRNPDQRHDDSSALVDVDRSEAEDAKPRLGEEVLAAVIGHQPVAVVAAVVLDHQSGPWVVQIGPSEEPPFVVVEVGLHLWPR